MDAPKPGQGIDIEQMRNALQLAEARIGLQTMKLEAFLAMHRQEAVMLHWAADHLIPAGKHTPLINFLEARKEYVQAEEGLMRVAIAEIQGQAAIYRAAIGEAKRNFLPGADKSKLLV